MPERVRVAAPNHVRVKIEVALKRHESEQLMFEAYDGPALIGKRQDVRKPLMEAGFAQGSFVLFTAIQGYGSFGVVSADGINRDENIPEVFGLAVAGENVTFGLFMGT